MFSKGKMAGRPSFTFDVATFLAIALCGSPIAAADHPLQPLSAKEIRDSTSAVSRYFAANHLPTERILYPIIVLKEPPKSAVLGYLDHGGALPPRESKIEIMHYPTNRLWDATVDLASGTVIGLGLQSAGTQSSVTATEFVNADTVVHANANWKTAILARGLDPDQCYLDVWAPGDVPGPAGMAFGPNGRFLRVVAYYRGATKVIKNPPQNPYDRPIEGLVVSVDMNAETMVQGTPVQGKVVEILDTGIRPTPSESGNADQTRPALNPLIVSEPGGPNYVRTLTDGRRFHWQNWDFYAALHPHEGLVLYDVRFAGRRIAYRAALSEVYVPYGIGDTNWLWRSAFDVGEYLMGTLAQKLERDQDVPSNAQFLNAVIANDSGGSFSYPSSIGVFERFDGFAWSRTDPSTGGRDTRGARALVLHWNTWIGNYIYGFDWTFRQDGSLEVIVGATGTTVNRATATAAGEGPVDKAAPLVGVAPTIPGSASGGGGGMTYVRAPNHQHFLNFRFDFDVDGINNVAATRDIVHVPASEGGGDNVFEATETTITSEGAVSADPTRARSWEVRNAVARNSLGEPTAYAVELPYLAFPLSEPDYPPLLRAQFAAQPFWVTRYKDGELYAAGDHPNQGVEGKGLAAFTSDGDQLHASTTGTDIVTWITLGFTHSPRPEDYPVMSTERISFKITPHGFFSSNPTLDLAK